jgi:uncharacterized protein involved in tolerance to divalent cations
MINVYIYINNEEDAESLVSRLLEEGLVAHASIDRENNSMRLIDGKVVKELQYVITAQTRALLFNEIVKFVRLKFTQEPKIYSLPVTQCNDGFSEFIREQTKTAS